MTRTMLVVHTLAGGVLVGTSTHLAVQWWAHRGLRARPRLLSLYPRVAMVAWLIVLLGGSLVYPAYRLHVRAVWFEEHARWALSLFDVKENLAVFVGPLLWILARFSTVPTASDDARTHTRWGLALAITTMVIVWFNMISGLIITMERSL